MKARYDHIILGGGLTGLTLGRLLGPGSVVLEARDISGGLCRSFNRSGYTYDIGGHILFSRRREILNEMIGWLGDNLGPGRRNNQIWYNQHFIKYPFENGIFSLESEERLKVLLSYLERENMVPGNLEEWFRTRFGDALSEKYLLPYNRKIWKRDPKQLSLRWIERVPEPSLEDIARGAVGIETEGYTHQLNFFYPGQGGIQALTDSLSLSLGDRLFLDCPVHRIYREEDDWVVETPKGKMKSASLISTIPIFPLLDLLPDVPPLVEKAAQKLSYNSLITVLVGINNECLSGKTAIYIPDPDILPHRVCFMKQFSPGNVPKGCSSLLAEITVPPGGDLLTKENEWIVEQVVGQLSGLCGFSAREITVSEVRRFPYAYVVYDLDYDCNRDLVYDYLETLGIPTAGRFGSFRYLNMDACVEDAKQLALELES